MRRVRRSDGYEIELSIKEDSFINLPRAIQRSSLIKRALKEFSAGIEAIDEQARYFVPGNLDPEIRAINDCTYARLSHQEIMEDWSIPLIQRAADVVCESQCDILEIGVGRGISSDMIQAHDIASHTIIECNEQVMTDYFDQWKAKFPMSISKIVQGLWQETMVDIGLFDGIFFHTYTLNEEEYMTYIQESITFVEHFFPYAANHLKEDVAFTYFSNEIDSLSREHQGFLLKHFRSFSLQIVSLKMPEDVKDFWWANSIAVVKAIK